MHAHQILLMLLAPHERSSGLGLQYCGLATGLKQSYHMQHKFLSVFSLQSLSVTQAAENIVGPNAMRATGRLDFNQILSRGLRKSWCI
jgi:hypothetical protein